VTATVVSDLGESVDDLNDSGGGGAACVVDLDGATRLVALKVDLDPAGAAGRDAIAVLLAAAGDLLAIGTRTERMNDRGFQTGV
jgi:hypothetical protein